MPVIKPAVRSMTFSTLRMRRGKEKLRSFRSDWRGRRENFRTTLRTTTRL